jgi:hypothetical protein
MALDQALALLNSHRLNPVQRPEFSLQPLDVLGRDDVLEHVGTIGSLFTSTVAVPAPIAVQPAEGFNGQQTEEMHASVAERLMVRLLRALGSRAEKIELAALGTDVRFMRFEFNEVEIVSVAPQDVAGYLFSAEPHAGPVRDRYLANPEADAFVVTNVLQSRVLRVLPTEVGGEPVAPVVAALTEAVGDAVRVKATRRGVQFTGETPMTLAFGCFRIARAGGTWGLAGNLGEPVLIAPGTRVMVMSF